MFRLTYRLMLLLLPVFALLSLVALLFQANRPASETPLIDQVCELPCWHGITPGKTDFEDATAILQRNLSEIISPPTVSGSLLTFGAKIDGQQVSGVVDYEQGKVNGIRLNASLPLADLLNTLGPPSCVTIPSTARMTASNQMVVMVLLWQVENLYVQTMLVADGPKQVVKATMPAQSLNIGRGVAVCDYYSQPWLGFAPVWHYIRMSPTVS